MVCRVRVERQRRQHHLTPFGLHDAARRHPTRPTAQPCASLVPWSGWSRERRTNTLRLKQWRPSVQCRQRGSAHARYYRLAAGEICCHSLRRTATHRGYAKICSELRDLLTGQDGHSEGLVGAADLGVVGDEGVYGYNYRLSARDERRDPAGGR